MAKKASKKRTKKTSPSKSKARPVPNSIKGYVVIESTKRPNGRASAKVARSAGAGNLDGLKAGGHQTRRRGRIVLLRRKATGSVHDRGNDLGDKAGYLDPAGRLKYQQG